MRVFSVAVAVLSVGLGLACAAILWRSARRGSPSLPAVLWSAALGIVAAVLGGAACVAAFESIFALAHWWYVLIVVSVPMAGVGILIATSTAPAGNRLRPWSVALGALLVLPGFVGVYATHIAPYRLAVSEFSMALPEQRSGEQPLRMAVLADIQTRAIGDHERRAIEVAIAENPDLILVPGDILQAPWDEAQSQIPELNEMFTELAAAAPTVVVSGDVDNPAELEAILEGTGARLLSNEVVNLAIGGHQLAVAGISVVDGCGNPQHRAPLSELAAIEDPAVTRLLVTHRPDPVLCMQPGDADLVVAGHTHGGQISVPFFGPIATASEVPRSVGAGGFHELGGVPIVVSRGIGMERNYAPQVRLGVPPEVVFVDLVPN